MRFLLLLGVLVLPAAAAAAAVPYDQPFVLSVGAAAEVGDEGVRAGFTGIAADSRCPAGLLCFWPGDAAADLWLERPGEPRLPFTLHTYDAWGRSLDLGPVRVTLVRVAPYPVDGEDPIDPDAYVVTLTVSPLVVPAAPTGWSTAKARYR